MAESDEMTPRELLTGFFRKLEEKDNRIFYRFFSYYAGSPSVIESDEKRIPFNVSVTGRNVSRLLVDSIGFGILYEQENPSERNTNDTPHIVAPFGYYKTEDVIEEQGNERLKKLFKMLQQGSKGWKSDEFKGVLANETGLTLPVVNAVTLAVSFGGYLEAARINEIPPQERPTE